MNDEDLKQLMESMHAQTRSELRGYIDEKNAELRAELRGDMGEMRAELRGEMGEMRAEFRGEVREMRTEILRHLHVVAEGLETKIDAVAEGVAGNTERINALDVRVERLEETVDDFRTEVKAEFFKMDQRVSRLEKVAH